MQFWILELIIIIYHNNWLLPSRRSKKFQLTLSIKRSANNTVIVSFLFCILTHLQLILQIDCLKRKNTSLKFTLKIFLLNHKYYFCRKELLTLTVLTLLAEGERRAGALVGPDTTPSSLTVRVAHRWGAHTGYTNTFILF